MRRDPAYFNELKENLYSAVISDILDDMGYRNQTMNDSIRPLMRHMVIVGRAYPVLAADIFEIPDHPYEGLIDSLDGMNEGDVYVVSLPSNRTAVWGELLSNAAIARGSRGALIEGCIRDCRKIEQLDFPVFSSGYIPRDSKGRNVILQHGVPIECAGVLVQPGDLLFCDFDGVAVIPQEVEDRVLTLGLHKVSGENQVREAIRQGMLVRDAFDRYGVL